MTDRFWSKVTKTEACWLWTASVGSHGYGQFSVDRRPVLAHRLSYEMTRGPIPSGLVVDHLCRVTRCVNPAHMELVTKGENTRRSEWRDGRCKRGHDVTGPNVATYTLQTGQRRQRCRACFNDWQRKRRVSGSR